MTRVHYWIHHTGTYEGNTGIQRVVRNLAATLVEAGCDLVPVRWCALREALVLAEPEWLAGLGRFGGPILAPDIQAGTPLHLLNAGTGEAADSERLQATWLLLPEVPHVAGEDAPNLAVALDYARFHGLRTAAIFYDLIPLLRPGYEAMADAHAQYARALVAADLVVAISDHAAGDLRAWWHDQGYDAVRLPPVAALPLPEEIIGVPRGFASREAGTAEEAGNAPASPAINFLAVGTVEPRKNQVEVMRAFARLCRRRQDLDLHLDVVGNLHHAVAEAVSDIAAREKRVRVHRYLPDSDVLRMMAAAHATVFVSHDEGFGLPIAESLWCGVPCLCSDHGPMAELASGGGCLTVDAADTAAIEQGLERLAQDPALRARLAGEARSRPLRTWLDYAAEILAVLANAPRLHRLVVLEGTRGDHETPACLAGAGVATRLLHWRADSQSLLPGRPGAPQVPKPGDGQLRGGWASLREASTESPAQARAIVAIAHGLGLQVAVQAAPGGDLAVLAAADLALFPDAASRDAALSAALRDLPKTVGLRARFRVGTGVGCLEALAHCRPRLASAGAPLWPRRVFYWVGLTATQNFNTGVQRVARLLGAALQRRGIELVPVKWDVETETLAPLSPVEAAHLAAWSGPVTVPIAALPRDLAGEWLILPEITMPSVPPGSHVGRLAKSLGMRLAVIFYDVIPIRQRQLYTAWTLEQLHLYWQGFAEADLALPISWTAAADLVRWLAGEQLPVPPIAVCPLAGDAGATPRATAAPAPLKPGKPLRLLAVGSWEPRKNYPRLLRALAAAQARAHRPIRLTIVGRHVDMPELDAEIERLGRAAGADLRDHVTDEELLALYAACNATVFASRDEGFGLPVLESFWRGRACLCHHGSAMAEVAPGGGALAIDMLDETAIADALVRLADEPGLLERLGEEALARPIRDWAEYAEDVLRALARHGAAPGWPLPAIARRRPLLTCAITTYNRAPWLAHSLPRLLEATRPWRDIVEVVVCDNASTDGTASLLAQFDGEANFSTHRTRENVGMLGNLGQTARLARGAFVWLLGDDDLLTDGAIENVLEGLAAHPDVEMAYLNYAYTGFDEPEQLADPAAVIAAATPIAPGGPNRRVNELRSVAGLNENLFTAIYACVFRRDHALRAYQLDTRGAPFSSLATCVPSSVYALAALQDRPAWWVGEPALVVNLNVSWLRWVLLWHLERMPELYEAAELAGIDPARLDQYRLGHLSEAETWVRAIYFEAEDAVRAHFSMARLLERSKHLREFRERHLPGVRRAYADAWAAARVAEAPGDLFGTYGL